MSLSTIRIDVHLTPTDLAADLRADVLAGLTSEPKQLPPKWFYDEVGCELFEEIMRLPEYYPTRREREILYSESATIARLTGADTLVELGSGSSEKTLLLLDGLWRSGTLRRYVPLDVSETWLRGLSSAVAERYPGIEIHGVVGDFERHIPVLPLGGRSLIAFLGGTIGNMPPPRRRAFLGALVDIMQPGDALLLGADLVKPIGRLEAAYDDEADVTAAFNLNVLNVLNRELDANFDLQRFRHVARFDREHEWVEMLLRSRVDQRVSLNALGLTIYFAEGEEMRTEISSKFRRERLEAELTQSGLELVRFWTDSHGDFSLSLAVR